MQGSSFRLMGGLKSFSAEFPRSVTRFLPTLLAALVAALPSWQALGAPATADQANRVVQGWLRADATPLQTALGQQVKQVDTYKDAKGLPLYYVVNLEPKGFVIVAADDLVEPIIAFVPDGTYDPSSDNPLGAMVGSDLPNRMASVQGRQALNVQAASSAVQKKWAALTAVNQLPLSAAPSYVVSDLRVAPFLKTSWDQSVSWSYNDPYAACYNYYTPPYGDGNVNNFVCGCVATAMAQMMKHWEYPVVGVGTAAYSITNNGVGETRNLRGGNGLGGPYQWSNMETNPAGSVNLTVPQCQAIGALCADAGVAAHMNYSSAESGATVYNASIALTNAFRYSNAVFGSAQSDGWNDMLNPNLDCASPVLLGISRSGGGGHAIVCDGYGYNASTLYHHLNMGWSGSGNAWYNLPNVASTQVGGAYNYTQFDNCVYNVFTNGTGEIISGRVTDIYGAPFAGVTVTATRSAGGTYTATTDARGIYGLPKTPSSSTYTVTASKAGYNFTSTIVNTGLSANMGSTSGNKWGADLAALDPVAPGSFSASAVSWTEIDLSWVKNASNNNVLIAWSANNTFGTPSGSYSVGNAISGGGTVLYNGSGTSLADTTGLTAGTRRYYKAWSVLAGPTYSTGVAASSATPYTIPFSEGFEFFEALPNNWTYEYVHGSLGWNFIAGGASNWGIRDPTYPSGPHSGGYNAFFFFNSLTDDRTTKLVTPMLAFGSNTQNAQLSFYHCMAYYINSGGQDRLNVYYRTSANGAWTVLTNFTSSVTTWTQRTISLPNVNDSYYIAFEGVGLFGCGVCVDDVSVTGTVASKSSQTITGFTTPASALTTNTFALSATATPSGLPVSYAVISGLGSLAGSTLSFTGAGNVQVVASQAGNASYYAAPSITNTITVTKATAQVSLTAATLTQTYNGSQRFVTASTVPAGLLTNITYNGSGTAPTAAGNYAVVGSVDASVAMYQGSASGTLVVQSAGVQTYYVATNGNDTANGLSWATAKRTIQVAVDLTAAGDTVLVSNGVYATGGAIAPTLFASNRVVIAKNITVQSVNGPAVTTIRGLNGGAYSLADSVRCVFINSGNLSGFTLTNGCASSASWDDCGGGVNGGCTGSTSGSAGAGGTVRNCVITGCAAKWGGGGVAYGTYSNCLISANSVTSGAGGGGGVYKGLLNDCTVAGNSAVGSSAGGGGVNDGTLRNCIVYSNSGENYVGPLDFTSSCTTPLPGGTGNISGDPQFVNAAGGDFRLKSTSPCINAGDNTFVSGSADFDGVPRVVGGTVDMGAYEYQGATPLLLTASTDPTGTVSPASRYVAVGGSAVFNVNYANRYYRILDIKTNGVSAGWTFDNNSIAASFLWSNVQAAGSLYVTFTDRVTSDPGQPTYTWLSEHGLTRDTNGVNGSCSDTDHDGLTAWQEYLAGTDPTNAASALRMQQVSSAGGSNIIRWISSATVRSKYNLYSRTNLTSGSWALYTNNITSTPPTNTLVLPALGRTRMFFKVSVTN